MVKFYSLIKIIINNIRYRKEGCVIQRMALVHSDSVLEGKNLVGFRTTIRNSHIGYGTYISADSVVIDTQIGKYSCIGPQTLTALGKHPTKKFASIHPAFYSTNSPANFSYVNRNKFEEYSTNDSKRIIIGNDVWIGARVTIMDGVTIGDGAIIAAGAVVTENVAPYTIVGGVPARKIKDRFEDNVKRELLDIRWWDKPQKWIELNAELYEDAEKFLCSYLDF